MTSASEDRPTETDAIEVVQTLTGKTPASVRRFPDGLGHWVYDICGHDGLAMVVRMGTAEQRDDFDGSIYWSNILRPLGVPLPELIAHGDLRGYPYLALERLKGEDLGHVYADLTIDERKAIAEEVCNIQRVVGRMPTGNGYGFIRLPGDPCSKSWGEVVEASIARSRERIKVTGLVSLRLVDRVENHASQFSGYFSQVRATPFLDDVTTKNVLVHAGRFSGIVDVDWLCFGDSLFTVALTRTALLSSGANPDYTDHWCDLLALNKEERGTIRFYTALFSLDLISEFGQRCNQDVQRMDSERLTRLEKILEDHLDKAG